MHGIVDGIIGKGLTWSCTHNVICLACTAKSEKETRLD
jgi:hypothetical protein